MRFALTDEEFDHLLTAAHSGVTTVYEEETIEGETLCHSTDWVFINEARTHFVRLDGYGGTPTAEVVLAGGFFVCRSFRSQPVMRLAFAADGYDGPKFMASSGLWPYFHRAAYTVEKAEDGDPEALRFVIPPAADNGPLPAGMSGWRCSTTGLYRIHYVRCGKLVTFMEVPGPGPSASYVVSINDVIVTGQDGRAIPFEGFEEAHCAVDLEYLPEE